MLISKGSESLINIHILNGPMTKQNNTIMKTMENKQTSIEWFLNNVPRRFSNSFLNEYRDLIDQAKQVELDNMEDAWNNGYKS